MTMLKIGTAKTTINSKIGAYVQAATNMKKVKHVRDDLEANALLLETEDQGLLFINCDLVGVELEFAREAAAEIEKACGIPADTVLIGTTHTHAGPAVIPTCPGKPLEVEYLEELKRKLVEIAGQAVQSAAPGRIAWEKGSSQIGYNRRCCWADGSHTMHGDTTRPDFTGMEGGYDPQHTTLFVKNTEGNILAILYNHTTHPTTFYGADFLSADFVGLARSYFRDIFGDIAVLFFNGTSGDISLENQELKNSHNESAEQKMARAAHLIAGESLRQLHGAVFEDTLQLKHVSKKLQIPIRFPSEERLQWARKVLEEAGKTGALSLEIATAHHMVVLEERFGESKVEMVDLHVGSINGLGFVTAPCELFTHFGRCIKARSPFACTVILGHVNGLMGYCPTTEGIIGGHWGGDPTYSARWDEKAGYRIVDEAVALLHQIH